MTSGDGSPTPPRSRCTPGGAGGDGSGEGTRPVSEGPPLLRCEQLVLWQWCTHGLPSWPRICAHLTSAADLPQILRAGFAVGIPLNPQASPSPPLRCRARCTAPWSFLPDPLHPLPTSVLPPLSPAASCRWWWWCSCVSSLVVFLVVNLTVCVLGVFLMGLPDGCPVCRPWWCA